MLCGCRFRERSFSSFFFLMFSRDIWFSEDITISEHDDYDSIFPISQVVDSWANDGENKVNVVRTSRKL